MARYNPYSLPTERGKWRSFAMAAGIHILLLLTLYIGISFHKEKPLVVEAEIWDPVIKETGSAARVRPVPPPPKAVETPPPPPAPAVKAPPPAPAAQTPPQPDPEIALEKERERKRQEKQAAADAAREKAQQEEAEREREAEIKARHDEQKKAEAAHQKLLQQQQEQAAKAKQAEQEKAEKLKADQAAKEKAAKEKAEKAAKEKAAAQEKAAQEKREAAQRDRTLQMLQGQANNAATGNGDAARSQGPKGDPDYSQKVGAKIRSNINFAVPPTLSGNPAVEFEVNLLPDGSVASIRKLKPSGVPGFDEAVARAIQNSAPYPKNKDGTVPSSFIGTHKPKDQ